MLEKAFDPDRLNIRYIWFSSSCFSNSEKGRIADGIPIVSNLNNNDDIAWFGFTTNARYKSLMYVWTKQLTGQLMEKPEGYSKERIEEIVNKYTVLASEINQSRTSNRYCQ